MKKLATICATFAVAMLIMGAGDKPKHTVKPTNGFVPDAETAIAVAVAVWNPIYGKDHIAQKAPFIATLSHGIWTVRGSLPPDSFGGVPEAEIARTDARVLRVTHGK